MAANTSARTACNAATRARRDSGITRPPSSTCKNASRCSASRAGRMAVRRPSAARSLPKTGWSRRVTLCPSRWSSSFTVVTMNWRSSQLTWTTVPTECHPSTDTRGSTSRTRMPPGSRPSTKSKASTRATPVDTGSASSRSSAGTRRSTARAKAATRSPRSPGGLSRARIGSRASPSVGSSPGSIARGSIASGSIGSGSLGLGPIRPGSPTRAPRPAVRTTAAPRRGRRPDGG